MGTCMYCNGVGNMVVQGMSGRVGGRLEVGT